MMQSRIGCAIASASCAVLSPGAHRGGETTIALHALPAAHQREPVFRIVFIKKKARRDYTKMRGERFPGSPIESRSEEAKPKHMIDAIARIGCAHSAEAC